MKIECERCEELVSVARFEIEAAGIRVTCPRCEAAYSIPAAPPQPQPEPEPESAATSEPATTETDGERCPKCDAALAPESTACARCGLARDKFEQFAQDAEQSVPDELEALWVELGESWNDDGAHDRFCDAAVRVGAYAYAARCYRRALPQPDREEVARQRLEKVARMAEAHLISVANVARGRETESEPYRGVVILLIVLVLLLGIGGVYLVFRSSAQTDGSNRFQRAPADVEARVLRASALR